MTNWKKIWEEGLTLSQNSELKTDQDYKIIPNNHVERELGDYNIFDPYWVNTLKTALMSKSPSHAFEYWREQGWLKLALPELDLLWGRIQPENYHPEIDVGIHAMMVVDRSSYHNLPLSSRLACLFHDFGKSLTPLGVISHISHEKNGIPLIEKYLDGWKLNKEEKDVILTVGLYHGEVHGVESNNAKNLINLVNKMNFLNRESKLNANILNSIVCDDQGRKNMFNSFPRGVHTLKEAIIILSNFDEKLLPIAKKKLIEKEAKGIEYGAEPYDDLKKEKILNDIISKMKINEMHELLLRKQLEKKENVDKKIEHKKNSLSM